MVKMAIIPAALLAGVMLLNGCAGRDAHPVSTSQAQDTAMPCASILSEMQINDRKIGDLSTEKGWKAAQNIGGAILGFFTFGIGWAAMDFKEAASTEQDALQDRNAYLASVYEQRCTKVAEGVTE